jgi:hypothetical protein
VCVGGGGGGGEREFKSSRVQRDNDGVSMGGKGQRRGQEQ